MKLRHLLPVAMLSLPMLAQAVPAYPGILSMSNPDGSRLELKLFGDESFSYFTDAKGINVYEKNENGYWVKAVRNGAQILNVEADIQRLRDEQVLTGDEQIIRNNLPARYARVGNDGRSLFPTVGENLKFLVVLLQYRDTKFTMDDPQAFYTRWFNEENFNVQDLTHSARDYYMSVSSGKFKPTFVVSPVVTLPKSSSFYTGGNKYSNFSTAISTALRELDTNGFDFSQFDMDNNGQIDNIYFVYAGYGQADTGDENCIWPHKSDMSSYNLVFDGKKFGPYATSNELRGSSHYFSKDGTIQGIGTFCHEFGHVLGLPDLYDPQYADDTNDQIPGDWTIMCNGPYLDDSRTPPTYTAYEKWVCKWLELEDAIDNFNYSLKPLATDPRGIRIPVAGAPNEYYVIENRTRIGYDSFIPSSGLLIWHVDFDGDVWTANKVNSTAGRPRCSLMVPKDKNIKTAAWPADGLYGFFIAPNYDNAFVPFNSYNKDAFTPHLLNIEYNNESQIGSFRYSTKATTYNGEVKNFRGLQKEDGRTGFHLYWDRADGAVNYALTIKRYSDSDTTTRRFPYIVDNCQDRLLGDVNTVTITENKTMMGQLHVISIRPIGPDFPSSKETTFEARPIEDMNGVGEIEADDVNVEIYGSNGSIVAPADAVAFNLAGVKVGMENLPAGIYIVRYGNRTVKVNVK